MTRNPRLLTRALAVVAACAVALTGCQFKGIYSIPLPGGVATGDDAYTVTIHFADVLDLVPQSQVKVDNVTVGQVSGIELAGWHAKVTVQLKPNVRLPDNAVARIRQTSLLGEKYVALSEPTSRKASGKLSNGDLVPLSRTGQDIEVEQVLTALSLLLNGGGLPQIQTITRELNAALSGREKDVRQLLQRLDTFVAALDRQKADIVRALEGLENLSQKLKEQKETIADAVDQLTPAIEVLREQRSDITKLLTELDELGRVSKQVIRQTKEDLLTNLRSLQPILTELANAGDALPKALELLLTFPFPSTTPNALQGDYVNLRLKVALDLETILHNLFYGTPLAPANSPEQLRQRLLRAKQGEAQQANPDQPGQPGETGDSGQPGSGDDSEQDGPLSPPSSSSPEDGDQQQGQQGDGSDEPRSGSDALEKLLGF